MANYNSYTYSRLLEHLEDNIIIKKGQQVNCSEFLLTMNQSTSIKEMFDIYNKVYDVIRETSGSISYWELELNLCLNENIKRLYLTAKEPTDDFCNACLANLRRCNIVDDIIALITKKQGKHILPATQEITTAQHYMTEATLGMRMKKPGQYPTKDSPVVEKYFIATAVLLKYGFIESEAEHKLIEDYGIKPTTPIQDYINFQQSDIDILYEKYFNLKPAENKRMTNMNGTISWDTISWHDFKWWQWILIFVFMIGFIYIADVIMDAIGGPIGLLIIIGIPGALLTFLRR